MKCPIMLKRAVNIKYAGKRSHISIYNQSLQIADHDRYLYDGKYYNDNHIEEGMTYRGDISGRNKKQVVDGIKIYRHKNKRVFSIPGKKIVGGRGTKVSLTLSNIFKHDKDKVFDSVKTFADGKGGPGIKINKEQFNKAWDVANKQSIPRRLVKNIAKHPHRYGIGAIGIGAGAYAIHNMRSKKGGSELILPLSIKYASMAHDIIVARKDTNIHPSEAQIEAENYKKGTFKWNGLVIKLENPKGSTRSGTSPEGKKWSITMKHDYGYLKSTKSLSDGDTVDIFMGKNPESPVVYIVDQVNKDGSFDEHKCILGALTEDEARKTYLDNYEKGWTCGKITAMTIPHFKEWAMKGNTGKPVSEMKLFKIANTINMLTNVVACGTDTNNQGDNMKCPIMLKVARSWDNIVSNPEIDKIHMGARNRSGKIDMKKFRQLNIREIDKELAEGKGYHDSQKSRFLSGGKETKREVFDESLAMGTVGGFLGSIATPILSSPYHILRKIKKKPSLFGTSIVAGGLLGAITGATARGIYGRRKIQDPGEHEPDKEMTYAREEMLKPYVKGKRHYMNDIYGIADGGNIDFDMIKAGAKLNMKKITKPLGNVGNLALKGLWIGGSLKEFGNAFKTVKGLKPPISRI